MGFRNIVGHFVRTTSQKRQYFMWRFFIDEMVTDSIQNWTELNYLNLKVHQTIPAISSTCAWKNTISFLLENLFEIWKKNVYEIILLDYYWPFENCASTICSSTVGSKL